MGNSTNKKDAQANAARDFCQYLVRQGEMKAEDIPAMGQTQVSSFLTCNHTKSTQLFFISVHKHNIMKFTVFKSALHHYG